MAYGELARGLNDVGIYPLNASDVPGTLVDLPGARSLEWSVESDTETIEGDDQVLGVAAGAKRGTGSLTTARANLTALAAMLGTTVVTTGTGSTEVQTMDETSDANQTYFEVRGQALSVDASGSAFQVNIHKAKVTGTQETLENNAWLIPNVSFEFVEDVDGDFITRILQATRVALA